MQSCSWICDLNHCSSESKRRRKASQYLALGVPPQGWMLGSLCISKYFPTFNHVLDSMPSVLHILFNPTHSALWEELLPYFNKNRGLRRLWIVQGHTLLSDGATYAGSVGMTILKIIWSLSEQLSAGGSYYRRGKRTMFPSSRRQMFPLWHRAVCVTETS